MNIRENVEIVRESIREAERRSGRPEGSVKLLAATKMVEPERIREAVAAGVRMIGENKVQDAEKKRAELPAGIELHMIGHLQSNKAKKAVGLFDCIQSIDSVRLAHVLAAEASRAGKRLPAMLEVNIAEEESKNGFSERELRDGFGELQGISDLRLIGLMCIPPVMEESRSRPYFARLRELARSLFGTAPVELSMGMSHDFRAAIAEGSTIVRIGTALFGERY